MSRARATLDFITASAVEATFPLAMPLPLAATAVRVVRARNITDPAAVRYAAVELASYDVSGAQLRINFITGLEPSSRYVLTLEVDDET